MVRRVKCLYKVANWTGRAHKSLPVSWSLINHTHDHQKPGLTLSFSHSLATILCFTYSTCQILYTQIAECKATLRYTDGGQCVGWGTEGEGRDRQPHSAPRRQLLTHFLLEESGSWREDSCQIREGWLGHFEICIPLCKNLWEENRYQPFFCLFLGCYFSFTQS